MYGKLLYPLLSRFAQQKTIYIRLPKCLIRGNRRNQCTPARSLSLPASSKTVPGLMQYRALYLLLHCRR